MDNIATTSSAAPPIPPYTLYLYSPHPPSHPKLATLDPAGLYISSLLRTVAVAVTTSTTTTTTTTGPTSATSSSPSPSSLTLPFNIRPPSVYFHPHLPRLERNDPSTGRGVCVAEGVQGIETFLSSLDSAPRQERVEGIDYCDWQLKPLEAHLSANVEPLVYSVLFPLSTAGSSGGTTSRNSSLPRCVAEEIFNQITFPAYSRDLPFPLSRAIPHRLKERIHQQVISSSPLFRKLNSAARYEKLEKETARVDPEVERIRREMTPLGSGLGSGGGGRGGRGFLGFGSGEKEEWREEFWREKVITLTKEILSPLVPYVSTFSVSSAAELPRPLVHLYALLAPLILFSPTLPNGKPNPLSSHPVVQLLTTTTDYQVITTFVVQMHDKIWGSLPLSSSSSTSTSTEGVQEEGKDQVVIYGDWKEWQDLLLLWQASFFSSTSTSTQQQEDPTSSSSTATSTTTSSFWKFNWIPSFLTSTTRSSSLPTPPPPPPPSSSSSKGNKTKKHDYSDDVGLSPLQRQAQRKLQLGRTLWISSALVALFGTLFFSGIVQIRFEDDDDEDDDEEEEGEEGRMVGDDDSIGEELNDDDEEEEEEEIEEEEEEMIFEVGEEGDDEDEDDDS